MRTLPIPLVFASLLAGYLNLAQSDTPADDWKPIPSNQPRQQYPQVHSESRVRACVVAPQAQNVTFEFLGGVKASHDPGRRWGLDLRYAASGPGLSINWFAHCGYSTI